MNIEDGISDRRSVRRFQPQSIAREFINHIIEAAIAAPSAGNLHSRFFYVVENRQKRTELAAAAFDQPPVREAPALVVVCADMRINKEYGERGMNLYALMDCAASIQNMLLRAVALGLGTCWVGAFREDAVSRLLDLPSHLRPVAIVAIGYPAESPGVPPRPALDQVCRFG